VGSLLHAVTMSAPRTGVLITVGVILAATMRWMQIVHFSMTPSCRTVTSGQLHLEGSGKS